MNLDLQRRLLDEDLSAVSAAKLPRRPNSGWARAIRRALGMSARQTGNRMGISQSAVSQLEKAEIEKTITLQKLEELAAALGCKLAYHLVPEKPLQTMVRERAERLYEQERKAIEKTMALEDQSLKKQRKKATASERMLAVAYFMLKNPRRLWEE